MKDIYSSNQSPKGTTDFMDDNNTITNESRYSKVHEESKNALLRSFTCQGCVALVAMSNIKIQTKLQLPPQSPPKQSCYATRSENSVPLGQDCSREEVCRKQEYKLLRNRMKRSLNLNKTQLGFVFFFFLFKGQFDDS